ncbi:MAG: superoxide dismutase, partial [Bacteroidales bacterium]|nr:superoxide dismutase [Bacteroidales bacterium]
NKSLEYLLENLHSLPQEIQGAVQNHGGGHYNHSLFWHMMGPNGGKKQGPLFDEIVKRYKNFDAFVELFETTAKTRFGSGWAWLALNKQGDLELFSTANQDATLLQQAQPILGLDVWEHAYYLHYQNRRPDYIKAWWNVVNWDFVQERYIEIIGK